MSISTLVKKYEKNREYYVSDKYSEAQLRIDFLDEFFELLGWDIKNKNCKSTFEREVILEECIKGEEPYFKKPDYTFRLFNQRKFFVEAKKPSIKIENENGPAFQIRRYGFTAKLKISVLFNFEYLIIYDCSEPVKEGDNYNNCIIDRIHYTNYEKRFEDIKKLLSKDSVYTGMFDKELEKIDDKIKKYNIDILFLEQINDWRIKLGQSIYNIKPKIYENELNDCVQSYINSIIFLRVCEDRNIEDYHSLLKIKNENNFDKLFKKFKTADKRYNSKIFDLPYKDEIIEYSSSVFWDIISQLYYPNSPYSFAVISSYILGNIYEIFLSKKLKIKSTGIELTDKPENIDRDVVTTPLYIIQNILNSTLLNYLEAKDVEGIFKLKIADIACGSGSFLLEAFQYINDFLIDYYIKNDCKQLIETGIDSYKLNFQLKKQLIMNCIYGIDKDYNAVETTKFGLLLKLLEDETIDSLPSDNAILPELKHIYYGNSLIRPDEVSNYTKEQKEKVNAFDFGSLTFDVIVGNPPYMKTEDIKNILPLEKPIYESKFFTARKQYDKYFLFVEQSLNVLNDNGILGYILPSKFTKVDAGMGLRCLLKEGKHLKEIVSFGANQIFEDKTTYTNIIILTKKENDYFNYNEINDLKAFLLKQESNRNGHNSINIDNLDNVCWVLYANKYDNLYNKVCHNTQSLFDILNSEEENIANGIQTSRNDMYIINPDKEVNGLLYFKKFDKDWLIEKEFTRPYYKTPSKKVDKNLYTYRLLKPNAFVIYPYYMLDNKIKLYELEEISKKFPYAYKYLNENKKDFIYSARGRKRDIRPMPQTENEWYMYGRSHALKMGEIEQKIVVGIMSQGDKYAIDNNKTLISSGGTAGYCMIVLPKNCLYSIYYIQAILNSKMLEWLVTLVGEVYRGNYFARGTKVLEKLPIRKIDFNNESEKSLHDAISNIQKELINIYSDIDSCGEDKRKLSFLNNEFERIKLSLDNKLKELYNLTDEEYNQIPMIKDIYETD